MNAILNKSKVGRVGKAGFALALGLLIGAVAAVISLAEQVDRSVTPDGILKQLAAIAQQQAVDTTSIPSGFTLQLAAETTEEGFVVNVTVQVSKLYLRDPDILSSIVAAVASRQDGFQRLEAEIRKDAKQVFKLYFANAIVLQPFQEQLTNAVFHLANRTTLGPS